MTELTTLQCDACHANAPQVTEDEMAELLKQIPDWNIEVRDNIMQLEKRYQFKNFRSALKFTNQVGELAESEGHHPAILTEWGKVRVTWWTHAIKGLHKNDFICAAKTDNVNQGSVN